MEKVCFVGGYVVGDNADGVNVILVVMMMAIIMMMIFVVLLILIMMISECGDIINDDILTYTMNMIGAIVL